MIELHGGRANIPNTWSNLSVIISLDSTEDGNVFSRVVVASVQ